MPPTFPKNDASRLVRFLESVNTLDPTARATGGGLGWRRIFGLPDGGEDERLLHLAVEVAVLPIRVERKIRQIHGLEHDVFLSWVGQARQVLVNNLNMAASIESVRSGFTPDMLNLIKICATLIDRDNPDPALDEAKHNELLAAARSLLVEIRACEMEEWLRTYLIRHIMLIIRALEDYIIMGPDPVAAAGEQLVGSLFARPRERKAAMSLPTWQKIAALLTALVLLRDAVDAAESLTQRFAALLPGAQEAHGTESVNDSQLVSEPN